MGAKCQSGIPRRRKRRWGIKGAEEEEKRPIDSKKNSCLAHPSQVGSGHHRQAFSQFFARSGKLAQRLLASPAGRITSVGSRFLEKKGGGRKRGSFERLTCLSQPWRYTTDSKNFPVLRLNSGLQSNFDAWMSLCYLPWTLCQPRGRGRPPHSVSPLASVIPPPSSLPFSFLSFFLLLLPKMGGAFLKPLLLPSPAGCTISTTTTAIKEGKKKRGTREKSYDFAAAINMAVKSPLLSLPFPPNVSGRSSLLVWRF